MNIINSDDKSKLPHSGITVQVCDARKDKLENLSPAQKKYSVLFLIELFRHVRCMQLPVTKTITSVFLTTEVMVKSPLRYPGGKSRGVKFLKEFIPGFTEFREVFFGGGSLSFYLAQVAKDKRYFASDLNYELYCFWKQLRDNGEQLIAEIQKVYDGCKTDCVADGKLIFNTILKRRNSDLTELQRGVDFFVLNRITFSGVVDSGGYSQGSFEGRFTQSSIARLRETMPVIKNIEFFCEDFSYLANKPGKDVFIFLDPPYYAATKSKLYGKKGILHTSFDHLSLYETLKNSHHKWMITYDNSDYIRELYKEFFQVEWQLQYGMTNSNHSASVLGNELLIANYDLLSVQRGTR